ncbi:uncharacterized protein [Gorilla gorilla gorilla]|uniref:uncharacterized protein n=1 Tax=Gorilla gorilla gorilla TaxID=9595 RepID=UPI003009E0E6
MEKDARKRKVPAGPRVARGCAPWFLPTEQLPGPSLPSCSGKSSQVLRPAGSDSFPLTGRFQAQNCISNNSEMDPTNYDRNDDTFK